MEPASATPLNESKFVWWTDTEKEILGVGRRRMGKRRKQHDQLELEWVTKSLKSFKSYPMGTQHWRSAGEPPEWDLWPWWIREGCEYDSYATSRENKFLVEDERREAISSGESTSARPSFITSCGSPRDTTRQKLYGWSNIRVGPTSILCLRPRLDLEAEGLRAGEADESSSSADLFMPVAGHRDDEAYHRTEHDDSQCGRRWRSTQGTSSRNTDASSFEVDQSFWSCVQEHLRRSWDYAFWVWLVVRTWIWMMVVRTRKTDDDNWQLFKASAVEQVCLSSFSFNMWQIVHNIDTDICTLTQSLPCCCLPFWLFFFFFSLSTDRHSSVVLILTCARTWIEQPLSSICLLCLCKTRTVYTVILISYIIHHFHYFLHFLFFFCFFFVKFLNVFLIVFRASSFSSFFLFFFLQFSLCFFFFFFQHFSSFSPFFFIFHVSLCFFIFFFVFFFIFSYFRVSSFFVFFSSFPYVSVSFFLQFSSLSPFFFIFHHVASFSSLFFIVLGFSLFLNFIFLFFLKCV